MSDSGGSMTVLVTTIGGQRYGFPAVDVAEVHRVVAVRPLPGSPAVVEGVINRRGQIVPVLDIRARFTLPSAPVALTDHLVVARAGTRTVAVRVDRALHLAQVDLDQLDRTASVVPDLEHVAGVAATPDGLVVVHDLASFLAWDEAAALDGALDRCASEAGTP